MYRCAHPLILPSDPEDPMPSSPLPSTRITAAPDSGLCLGGLGCGGIELWADGVFRHAAFMNTAPWAGFRQPGNEGAPHEPQIGPEDLFLILRVQRRGQAPQLRFLFTGHGTAFNTWHHMSRTYKYATCPSMPAVTATARFPFTELRFEDPVLPVQVTVTAWSPFVAHDVEASSIPGFALDVTVTNTCNEELAVSVVWSAANLGGCDRADPRQRHELLQAEDGAIVQMHSLEGEAYATAGSLAMFARSADGQRLSAIAANPHFENIYHAIHAGGALDAPLLPAFLKREEQLSTVLDHPMHRNKGWLALQQTVAPGVRADLRFGLAWHFPHHVDRTGVRVGKAYERRFADAAAAARHLLAEGDTLRTRSAAWSDAVAQADLEPRFRAALLDQANTLVKATWFGREGGFFIWEGLGHCGIDTVDVDHYGSFGLATLFPTLRAQVIRQIAAGARPDGRIPHAYNRNILPEGIPEGEYRRNDVCAQFILGLYRDWRWSGDDSLLRDTYAVAGRAMRLLTSLDRDGSGLPTTEGGITYDHWHLVGKVTYMAGLHLAALQAMAGMAEAMGDSAAASAWRNQWERGRASADTTLWLGSHYRTVLRAGQEAVQDQRRAGDAYQEVYRTGDANAAALAAKPVDLGVHTDALNGEWIAAMLGLPRALDEGRARTHLRTTLARNRHTDAAFLANGSCADGSFPDEWPFSQWQNPWTGTEYFMAASCFAAGLEHEGLRIISDVHDRLDACGVRFCHNEAGDHYSRALSIWAAYHAWLGLVIDQPAGLLRIRARTPRPSWHGPLFTGSGWGDAAWGEVAGNPWFTLTWRQGGLHLRRLELPADLQSARVTLDGRIVSASLRSSGIDFDLELAAGNRLSVEPA
jgi:non-lysosomal glucosylceramidase